MPDWDRNYMGRWKMPSDLSAIRHKLVMMKLELEAVIQKLDEMQDQRFEVLNLISSAEFGKQRFFKESNGMIYDRLKNEYLLNVDAALDRYCREVGDE